MDNAAVPVEPLVALAPDQLPDAVHEVALLLDHEMVVPELFHGNGFGFAEMDVVTAGQELFDGTPAEQLLLQSRVPELVCPHALAPEVQLLP